MNKTKDWSAVTTPKVLLIGENSTLQWSDEVIDSVMFLNYFFNPKPYDLGERSRFTEAKMIFELVDKLTAGWCTPQCVYATNLSLDIHPRAPKGKHLLIPEEFATEGIERIRKILTDNPSIKYVFAMGMQVNYYLQKLGFYGCNEKFIHGSQPKTIGLTNRPPYYQPVDAKVFRPICGNFFEIKGSKVELIPILPAKDYPLTPENMEKYGDCYEVVQQWFKKHYNITY